MLTSPFVDASALLRPNPAELSYGCVMADFDRDGLPEILVVTVGGANRLYKWDDSRLIDIAPPILQDTDASGIGVAVADFTGNGWLDIYLLNTSTFLGPHSDPDRLLIHHGNLHFTDAFHDEPLRNIAAGRSVCWFDPLGQFRYMAYVCNYAFPCRLYARDDAGTLVDIAPDWALDQFTGGRSAVAVDLFCTGRIDLITGNENDQNRVFRNLGAGQFEEVAHQLGLADPFNHARGLAAFDFNRDGRVDLVWGNWEGPHRLMRQGADGRFVNVASDELARPSRVRTVIAFDYDNDGWEDLFFNNIGQPNRLFHNNGDGTFTEVDPGPLALPNGLGTGATVGDINGDGFLDLFIAHGESSAMPNALFLNRPNGNRWLRVHPLTPAGAPAIGSRVVVYTPGDDRPMTRFIDGGSGYLCQMEPVAHFGLAQSTAAAIVRVHFTNGQQIELRDVAANQNVYLRATGSDVEVTMVGEEEH
jgi:hypothetical protein